jgi:hypothetical protein
MYIKETIQKHSKYKYTYYQNMHTIVKKSQIKKPTQTHMHTLQNPYIHTLTHCKTHTYTHSHIRKQVKITTVQDTHQIK